MLCRNSDDAMVLNEQDVVSYQVKRLHPVLQLEQIGEPTGKSQTHIG
jgi:hypothetical protein